MIFRSNNPRQTFLLGYTVGKIITSGTTICLNGPLGSGKTTFVQGLSSALKTKPKATSPSFRLINEYKGIIPVYHFDLYRLRDIKDFENLGYREYFQRQGITLIEWGDKFDFILPKDYLKINFEYFNDSSRIIRLNTKSPFYKKMLKIVERSYENIRLRNKR